MIGGKSVLGVIPARAGSKGVPRKNARTLCGKPLLGWTIDAARGAACLDRVVLSSDDDEIMDLGRSLGCEVPHRRPAHLASDTAMVVDVVLNLLDTMRERFDFVVLLQPTSPLREARDIDGAAAACFAAGAPACASVVAAEQSPYLMYRLEAAGRMVPVLGEGTSSRRQDLPQIYALNGAVYVTESERLRAERKFVGANAVGYEMPRERSIDIDSELDFALAGLLLEARERAPTKPAATPLTSRRQ